MKYRCLIPLSMIYALLHCISPILHGKYISFPVYFTYYTSIGILLSALWFSLCDIIAEVYGMKLSIHLFWTCTLCCLFILPLCEYLIQPHSSYISPEQSFYNYIFGHIFYMNLLSTVAVIIGWYINIFCLTKWKILTGGKHFWLRSIGSTFIGQAVYMLSNAIFFYIIQPYTYMQNGFLAGFLSSLLLKMMFVILLAFPASLVVFLLKMVEKTNDSSENEFQSYNPFKIS